MNPLEQKYNLIAFLSVLVAIVILVIVGAYMSADGKPIEALGIGGAVTGLIGVIGTFKPKSPAQEQVQIANPPSRPVPVVEPAAPAPAATPAPTAQPQAEPAADDLPSWAK